MLFTGKGDSGQTKNFNGKKVSKGGALMEALGSLDEINSLLGFCKVRSDDAGFSTQGKKFSEIVHELQQALFIIQAEVAGFPMQTEQPRVKDLELFINAVEKEMPPIRTFFISGGTELAATFDFARTIARRAERRVVALHESGEAAVSPETLAYMNRLSSVLYALARLTNHKSGIKEEPPAYNRDKQAE